MPRVPRNQPATLLLNSLSRQMKLTVISVTPSPYQRDFFSALAQHPAVELQVNYLEGQTPDSPWPEKPLASYERVLPGRVWGQRRVRCHWNALGDGWEGTDAVLMNTTLTAVTTQRLFHGKLRHIPWFFWGELLRTDGYVWKNFLRDRLAAPLRRASGIFAIGSRAAEDYHHRFPGVPVWNMPYRCELERFSRQAARKVDTPGRIVTFLFCGQMIARKGVDVLLEAFAAIMQSGHDARLLLSGREGDLQGWLAKLDESTRSRVEYRGFTAPEDLPALFSEADVFVMPSRHDGWGVVVNQAIGAGLPVIATDAVGAAHDLVNHEVNGLLVTAGDAVALAEAMSRLADDPALRRRIAGQSQELRKWLEPSAGVNEMLHAMGSTLDLRG